MEQQCSTQNCLSEKCAASEHSLDDTVGQIKLSEELKACLVVIFPLKLINQSNILLTIIRTLVKKIRYNSESHVLVQSREGLWLK